MHLSGLETIDCLRRCPLDEHKPRSSCQSPKFQKEGLQKTSLPQGGRDRSHRDQRNDEHLGAEKVSSLGKNWHRFCLKCERCHSILSPGGHAEHNGRPYCHKPCYGALFGPRGVNIGGVGSYLYNSPTLTPASTTPLSPSSFSPPRPRTGLPQGKKSPLHMKTFTGETSLCPGCEEPVYFAEKVMSLGRNWHRPCLRCQRCRKTLTAGSHAEV
ncbi:cysteine-rich protein 3 isoform X2 [Canis lupus baileyi]|uniref:cysteine-rich protein 3 isoform X2 n=1 Tax=Canis lupus baileyi TaxID=143281 RepID=UPI003B9766BF